MSFDPGLGGFQTNGNDSTNDGSIPGYDAYGNPLPTGDLVTLPDGHTVLLDKKTGRIIKDFGVKPVTAANNYTPASGGQMLANQQDQAALAEQARQYDLTQGERKARGDQQMNLDTELGRGQLGVSQGNLAVNQGNLALGQGRLSLDNLKQQFDQYTTLANLASNPRNYVQTFFMNRGLQAPPDVARYGNTQTNAAGIMPFSQFIQKQMGAPASSSPQVQPAANVYGSTQNNPSNPYAGTNVNYGGSPTTADTAMVNGVKVWAGGAYSGKPVDSSPANAGDLTPYLQNPNLADPTGRVNPMQQIPKYAKGGVLQMMGPHAVVNLLTGKVAAIAGEAGPEKAYFDGAAIIDPGMSEDPYGGGGNQYLPGYGPGFDTTSAGTTPQQTGSQYLPGSEPTPYNIPQIPTQSWSQTDLASMIAAANAGNQQQAQPTTTQPTTQPTGGTTYQTQPFNNYAQPITAQPMAATQPVDSKANAATSYYQNWQNMQPLVNTSAEPQPLSSVIPQSVIQQPGATPQTNYQTGETSYSPSSLVSNITPASVAPAGTFGQPIPSQMPSYLAGENFQGNSDILRALQASGSVPPFLQRLFAQGRGDPTQGTNTPQRTDLPPDLPLVSKLAWQQLAPSEQQAFLSYVSSLGVTPEDYLAMVYANSPQGGSAQSPLFGNATAFTRQ